MRISNASFKSFPPFADGSISFPNGSISFPVPQDHPENLAEVHFFVGANGTGKTRFLSLLLAALGNSTELNRRLNHTKIEASVLLDLDENEKLAFLMGEDGSSAYYRHKTLSFPVPLPTHQKDFRHFHRISGSLTDVLKVIAKGPPPKGIFRCAALAFKGASAEVCDAAVSAMAPVKMGAPEEHLVFGRSQNEDVIVGQSMVNLKMGAAMDQLEGGMGRSSIMAKRIEDTVSAITGRPFSFRVEPTPKVSLRVNWGNARMMALQQLPDGLRAIIGWLVSCAAKLEALYPDEPKPLDLPVVVVIDEPEGHLHPAWQRTVLPALQRLLPKAQIFAATHSPWIISSVNHGFIHVFRVNEKEEVEIQEPLPCSKGDTYIDVIEDILGVTERYDPDTETLLSDYRSKRDALKAKGEGSMDEVQKLAELIAKRSQSLSLMMGREIAQLERHLCVK